ncbi:hypothetical protein GIB67_014095 [Kingdonia uniflora]|uniref:Uncharacterized protein n=1 Tax=Kingdonia uniflora TaxID=39325 RepID=A0A7J7KXH3_9MAGN|nr:hypothetical protein GIB67_014095 [Kingdonia uniflora]
MMMLEFIKGRKPVSMSMVMPPCTNLKMLLSNMMHQLHHEHASLPGNAHDTMLTRGGSGGFDQQIIILNDQLQKLKEDKEKESEAYINLRETLKEKVSYTYHHPT